MFGLMVVESITGKMPKTHSVQHSFLSHEMKSTREPFHI